MSDEAVHKPYGKLNYGSYLKVPELLDLQELQSESQAHDEMLFIVIHQAYELWFKLVLFELDSVAEALKVDDTFEAVRLLARVHKIESLLVHQIHVLETMTPRDFLSFRAALNPASGFQSVQFREVEFASGMKSAAILKSIETTDAERARLARRLEEPSLRELFYELLQRKGFDVAVPPAAGQLEGEALQRTMAELLRLYEHPDKFYNLYTLAEALVTHDQNLLLWRFHHVRVVERLIGAKMGTGGSAGVRYLESTLEKRAFPMLWQARGQMSDAEFFNTKRGRNETV